MTRREMIEEMYQILNEYEPEEEWEFNDEERCIRNTKLLIENFVKKYNFHDHYNIDIEKIKECNKEDVYFKTEYGEVGIRRFNKIYNSDKQPNNELLMYYRFSIGPYTFTKSWSDSYYFKDLFDEFFEELKKYNYSYIDEENRNIYFDVPEGIKLFKEYGKICDKYKEKFEIKCKEKKREQLQKQLENL